MGKASECCESYRKKGKFCKDCPLRSTLSKEERRRLLGSAGKGREKGKKGGARKKSKDAGKRKDGKKGG